MLHHPMPFFLNYHDWHRSWFLQNLGREFLRLGRKRLHGRVDPSRHWAAITLQPTHELVVTPKTKSCRESEQKSWSAESLQTPSGSLQDHSVFADLSLNEVWGLWHSVAGDKKPWILVTQSSGTQRLGPPPQAGNQAFLCPAISYHFNFHSRQLFARKSHGVVIPKSKYCHPPPSSQSHVSPHKLRQKTFSQINIRAAGGCWRKLRFHFCKFCPSLSFLCKSPDICGGAGASWRLYIFSGPESRLWSLRFKLFAFVQIKDWIILTKLKECKENVSRLEAPWWWWWRW